MGSVLAFEMLDRDRCFSIALKTYSEAVADGFEPIVHIICEPICFDCIKERSVKGEPI